jgi:ADP-ribose pyrophosphatase YjhB (NUDIX family)
MTKNSGDSYDPQWLVWSREMAALAQTGLTFTRDPYDRERYEKLRSLSAKIVAKHVNLDAAHVELRRRIAGFRNEERFDVRGAVFEAGRLLLVRETADDGRWTLPGGWADVGESPVECVTKEVREESGYEVRVRKLAAVWDRARHAHAPPFLFHIWKLFFICEVVGGEAAGSMESSEPTFFAEDALPANLSTSRVLAWQLQRMFEHARDPALPTDYE